MTENVVARNYAEVLLELGLREGNVEGYAQAIGDLADWMQREPEIRLFLVTPRVPLSEKKGALRQALGGAVPERFLRYLFVLLDNGRQGLLPEIASEFWKLLNEELGRVDAEIVLAGEPDAQLRERIESRIAAWVGRPIVPHYRIDPRILGGVIVRVRDWVADGSLRRRLAGLRTALLRGKMPAAA